MYFVHLYVRTTTCSALRNEAIKSPSNTPCKLIEGVSRRKFRNVRSATVIAKERHVMNRNIRSDTI